MLPITSTIDKLPGEGSLILKAQEMNLITWVAAAALSSMTIGAYLLLCQANASVCFYLITSGGAVLSADCLAEWVGRVKRGERHACLEECFLTTWFDVSDSFNAFLLNGQGAINKNAFDLKAHFVVENFAQYRKLNLNSTDREFLKNLTKEHVRANVRLQKPKLVDKTIDAELENIIEIPGFGVMAIYSTEGRGSCGMHALLGEADRGKFRCNDVKKMRSDLANWVENSFKNGELPTSLKFLMADYLANIRFAPSDIQTELKNDYTHICNSYAQAKKEEEREEILIKFITLALPGYKKLLRNQSEFLHIQELSLAAQCFNKTLILCKPPEGFTDRRKNSEVEIYEINPGHERVYIWYNGSDHYCHAEIINWDGSVPKTDSREGSPISFDQALEDTNKEDPNQPGTSTKFHTFSVNSFPIEPGSSK